MSRTGASSSVSATSAESRRRSRPGPRLAAAFAIAALLITAPSSAEEVLGATVGAAFGPDGRLWRAVPRRSFVEVGYSTDLGSTFSEPVRVNRKRQKIRADSEGPPQILVDGKGRVLVAYNADAELPAAAFFSYSGDDGRTFTEPVTVPAGAPDPPHLRLLMELSGEGSATLLWLDASSDDAGGGDLHGTIFGGPLLAEPAPAMVTRKIADRTCECCRMDMAPLPDGGFALISRMVFPGMIRDIGTRRIAADGSATGPALRLTYDEWQINACPEHGPALSIGATGRYHFAWFTQGAQRKGLFYAHAEAGGERVSEPRRLGDPARLAGHADVLARGERVAVVWREYDGERNYVRLIRSADNGETWSDVVELAAARGATDYPRLLSHGTTMYVAWYSAADGFRLMPVSGEGES